MTDQATPPTEDTADDQPPIFRTWRQMYLFVLVLHALLIAAFYWFTRIYS